MFVDDGLCGKPGGSLACLHRSAILSPLPTNLERQQVLRASEVAVEVKGPAGFTALLVATELGSGFGGVSTFNRLGGAAMARRGSRVLCLLPKVLTGDWDLAARLGMEIVLPPDPIGSEGVAALYRRPRLPPGVVPDVIFGHGRPTGPAARGVHDHFPDARRVQVIHVAPEEIEPAKHRSGDAGTRADSRMREEVELAMGADTILIVGPRLYNRYIAEFDARDGPPVLRVDPGFDGVNRPVIQPPRGLLRVLVLGRMEDAPLKGVYEVAAALSQALESLRGDAPMVELVVRGAPRRSCDRLREEIQTHVRHAHLTVDVKPYSSSSESIEADLRKASLVMMASRSEGFGLVAVEAIATGVPVLMTSRSGCAELLREALDPVMAAPFVVDMTGNGPRDVDALAIKIAHVLQDRDQAFGRTILLRNALIRAGKTWSAAAAVMLDAAGFQQPVG